MRNRLLLIALALSALLAMALLIEGFVRDVLVVPLLYAVWIARLFWDSIPQGLLWAAFVLVVVASAARSIVTQRPMRHVRTEETERRGRVEEWASLVNLAQQGDFSRWRLAQRLGQLALEVLPEQDLLASKRSVRRLQSETLDIPPAIRAYLQAPMPMARSRRRLRAASRGGPFDLDPEQVVQFLEDNVHRPTGGST